MLSALESVAPVVLCAGIGWLWARSGQPFRRVEISRVIADIGAPCLVFSQLLSAQVSAAQLGEMATAAALVLLLGATLAAPLLWALGKPLQTFLAPLIFGNSGNLGMGLALFAFGPQGLTLATAYFLVVSLAQFTVGIWIWRGSQSARAILTTPMTFAAAIAVTMKLAQIPAPDWLLDTTRLLAGITIPLMLLALGVTLHDLRISPVSSAIGMGALRLLLGFSVGLAVAWLLDLQGLARKVVILQGAMPSAVFNYLLAERYQRTPDQVAGLVVASTLMAFLLLPVLLAFLS